MTHPIKHAENSVRLFGGVAEHYLPLHDWFDGTKEFMADWLAYASRVASSLASRTESTSSKETLAEAVATYLLIASCSGFIPSA